MNIRFLAQSEYFNSIHLKDDIILEKEYEQGRFENLPLVKYYLYYLEENVRKEVLPRTEKVDVFNIVDCQYESDYLYFTEYDDQLDGTYSLNIIKYNIVDHTHTKIISLKDNINLYPTEKEIKIFVLDDANLIIQRALPVKCASGYSGFFNYSLILFNYVKNKQVYITDDNLVKTGIDFMIPYNETNCILKTGYSLLPEDRRNRLTKDEAVMESIYVINIQQFISDLQLEQANLVLTAIDQCFYDITFVRAKVVDNYLIYSKYNYESQSEEISFYNIDAKETYTCINKTTTGKSLLKNATIIEQKPYMLSVNASGTQFLNLQTNEIETTYPEEYKIRYVNNNTVISTNIEKTLFGKEKEMVCIHKYPAKKAILQEKGIYIGAISSNKETAYIFLK